MKSKTFSKYKHHTKIRPLGDILLDLEPLLEEIIDTHSIQKGEIVSLVDVWVQIHRPDAVEKYVDGSPSPVLYKPGKKRKKK
jgi:hypothetical protein